MVDLPLSPSRTGWWAALVVVPLALAGVALVWPGAPEVAPVAAPAPVAVDVAPPVSLPTASAPTVSLPTVAPEAPAGRLAAALATVPAPLFAADSAALSDAARASVTSAADLLRAAPSVAVTVAGYCADTPGPPEVAQRLSEQRAAVVADALVAAGIARDRLTTVGRGDTAPLATAAASRRVEIRVR